MTLVVFRKSSVIARAKQKLHKLSSMLNQQFIWLCDLKIDFEKLIITGTKSKFWRECKRIN